MALPIDPNPVPARICTATTDDPALSRYAKVCKIWHTQLQEYVEENPFEALTFPRSTNVECAVEQLALLNASIENGNIEGAKLFGRRAMTCFHGLASSDIDGYRGDHLEVLQFIGDAAEVVAYGALIAEAALVVVYFAPGVLIGVGGTGTLGTVGGGALAVSACADIEYDAPLDPDGNDAVGGDGTGGTDYVEDDAQAGADQTGVDQSAEIATPIDCGESLMVFSGLRGSGVGRESCSFGNIPDSVSIMSQISGDEPLVESVLSRADYSPGDTVEVCMKSSFTEDPVTCTLRFAPQERDYTGLNRWTISCAETLGFPRMSYAEFVVLSGGVDFFVTWNDCSVAQYSDLP